MSIYVINNGVHKELSSILTSVNGGGVELDKVSTIENGVERVLHEPVQVNADIEKVIFKESIAYQYWWSKNNNKWVGSGYVNKWTGSYMSQLDNGYMASIGVYNRDPTSSLDGNGVRMNFIPYVVSSDGSKSLMTEEIMHLIKWTANFMVECFDDIRGGYDTSNRTMVKILTPDGGDIGLSKTSSGQFSESATRTGIDKRAYNTKYDYSIQLLIESLSSHTLSAGLQFTSFKIGKKQVPVEFQWSNMSQWQ